MAVPGVIHGKGERALLAISGAPTRRNGGRSSKGASIATRNGQWPGARQRLTRSLGKLMARAKDPLGCPTKSTRQDLDDSPDRVIPDALLQLSEIDTLEITTSWARITSPHEESGFLNAIVGRLSDARRVGDLHAPSRNWSLLFQTRSSRGFRPLTQPGRYGQPR